jgi:hypothetical protein
MYSHRCGGDDCIENLRLVRDRETNLTKGFGFLLLRDIDAVAEVVRGHNCSFRTSKYGTFVPNTVSQHSQFLGVVGIVIAQ